MDRDDATESMLRRAFAAGADGEQAGVCPDPELLGAMAEHALAVSERTRVEAHVADCARCQALLAAIVRTSPDVAPSTSWWQWRPGRWFAPVAAMALAAITWVAIQAPWRASEVRRETPVMQPGIGGARASPGANEGATARFGQEAPAPSNQPMPEPGAKPKSQAASLPENKETIASRAEQMSDRRDRQEPSPVGESRSIVGGKPVETADAIAPQAGRPSAAPVPPPPPASPSPVAEPPSAAYSAGAVAGTAKVAQDAAAAGRAAAGGVRDAGALAAAQQPGAVTETVNVSHEIVSPDPRSRWRLDPAGTISRSTDGGTSWQAQAPGTAGPFSAGSSPAPAVCWVVGARGAVLLSVDGQTWRQVAFPEPVDLTAVTATSGDAAVVTTNDRRTFVTNDRGRTWTRR